jgi:hypothetical protein
MNNQEFISYLIPLTKQNMVLQSLLISQICLESAYGKKHFYNNYLGIKCHKGVSCREANTKEYINGSYGDYKLAFAVYNDITDCIADYLSFMVYSRYKPVREAKNYFEATEQIRLCGYCTSPTYTNSLRKIIEKYKLYELDYNMNPDTQLTDNFTYREFFSGSASGIKIEPPEEYFETIQYIAIQLQKIRDMLGKPIYINSAYRTKEWNKYVGGATSSKHLEAKAVDIKVSGISPSDLALYFAKFTEFNGFGIARNFVHLDLRDKFTIWKY